MDPEIRPYPNITLILLINVIRVLKSPTNIDTFFVIIMTIVSVFVGLMSVYIDKPVYNGHPSGPGKCLMLTGCRYSEVD